MHFFFTESAKRSALSIKRPRWNVALSDHFGLLLYRCYYSLQSRYSVCPVWRIFVGLWWRRRKNILRNHWVKDYKKSGTQNVTWHLYPIPHGFRAGEAYTFEETLHIQFITIKFLFVDPWFGCRNRVSVWDLHVTSASFTTRFWD